MVLVDIFPPENNGLSFTVHGQEHEPVSVQVSYQPDETRLIGADCKQRGSRRMLFIRIHPYHRHLKRAACVEGILIHLAPHFDLVGTDIVHSLSPFRLESFSSYPILPKYEAAQTT
jgi:hypothetical protein